MLEVQVYSKSKSQMWMEHITYLKVEKGGVEGDEENREAKGRGSWKEKMHIGVAISLSSSEIPSC